MLGRSGEGLIHLKDLLAVLPASLKGLFEKEPVFEAFFLRKIAPNSAIFCQSAAEIRHRIDVFATDFIRAGQDPVALRAIPTSSEHRLAGRPKAQERPTVICRQAVTGFHQRVAGWLPIWLN